MAALDTAMEASRPWFSAVAPGGTWNFGVRSQLVLQLWKTKIVPWWLPKLSLMRGWCLDRSNCSVITYSGFWTIKAHLHVGGNIFKSSTPWKPEDPNLHSGLPPVSAAMLLARPFQDTCKAAAWWSLSSQRWALKSWHTVIVLNPKNSNNQHQFGLVSKP